MSARWRAHSAEGIMQEIPGVGIIKFWSTKTTPTNAANPSGYGPGCQWFYTPVSGPPKIYTNIGGNGMYVGATQNTAANWVQSDPTSLGQGQFGNPAGSLFYNDGGALYRTTLGATTSSTPAGIIPSAAGALKIVDVWTLPANAFDTIGRTLQFSVFGMAITGGSHAARIQVVANPTNVIVWPGNPAVNATNSGIAGKTDGTITVTGGTAILDTGSQTVATTTASISLYGQLVCAGTNLQESMTTGIINGSTHGGAGSWVDQALTSTAAIVFVVCISIGTTNTEFVYNGCVIDGYN